MKYLIEIDAPEDVGLSVAEILEEWARGGEVIDGLNEAETQVLFDLAERLREESVSARGEEGRV